MVIFSLTRRVHQDFHALQVVITWPPVIINCLAQLPQFPLVQADDHSRRGHYCPYTSVMRRTIAMVHALTLVIVTCV
ncbi:hypothetical protein HanRHA438_Chr04g0187841 [Helianthus annuus]|nr:hypothetical protein HanRHA438_Chr04g0187841 [Helianthus annuus]